MALNEIYYLKWHKFTFNAWHTYACWSHLLPKKLAFCRVATDSLFLMLLLLLLIFVYVISLILIICYLLFHILKPFKIYFHFITYAALCWANVQCESSTFRLNFYVHLFAAFLPVNQFALESARKSYVFLVGHILCREWVTFLSPTKAT